MHGLELDLDFENVCKACPCFDLLHAKSWTGGEWSVLPIWRKWQMNVSVYWSVLGYLFGTQSYIHSRELIDMLIDDENWALDFSDLELFQTLHNYNLLSSVDRKLDFPVLNTSQQLFVCDCENMSHKILKRCKGSSLYIVCAYSFTWNTRS